LTKTTAAILGIARMHNDNALKYNIKWSNHENGTNLDKPELGPCAAQQVERIASV